MVLIIILVFNLTWWQVLNQANTLKNGANPRNLMEDYSIRRGRIFTSDGVLLAESVERQAAIRYLRRYPAGGLYAHILGYDSPQLGRTGVEEEYNDYLLAKGKAEDPIGKLFKKDKSGYDLYLTIESEVQKAAAEALGNRRGAVIAINPKTGSVLAMVSYPTFDPNALVSQQRSQQGKLVSELVMENYSRDSSSPLLNRSTMGLYPPGSTFKVVTTAAALDGAGLPPTTAFDCPGSWAVGGFRVVNYDEKSYGTISMVDALRFSVNTYFAQLAVKVGGETLVDYAERGGMNQRIPLDYPAVEECSIPEASQMDLAELAWTGVGQGRLQVSPLQLCLYGCGIARGGEIMLPHLMNEIRDKEEVVTKFESKKWKRLMSSAAAATELEMMVKVVQSGTGTRAQIEGYTVAGKTGTAEAGGGKPNHSWFLGIAPAQNPQVVVAVVVENSGESGGRIAAPIARQVMLAALR